MTKAWYHIENTEDICSPALLVYPDRIAGNIETMIRIAGGTDRLRPHIKTHKIAEVIEMQMSCGIKKFKCATIGEAELLGSCGAADVLLALQPVGANIGRFFQLMEQFEGTRFSTIVDSPEIIAQLGKKAAEINRPVTLFADINVGMDRTGIKPGENAIALYTQMTTHPCLLPGGLHVYDGHLRQTDPAERGRACDKAFDQVLQLKAKLVQKGLDVPVIIAGGSPTFPIHAGRTGTETSPGTTLLWDERYATDFGEMGFIPAAILLTRIISIPALNTVCLDLGHKAIAPEMPLPRARVFGMEDCRQIGQSEEHLVLKCPGGKGFRVGDVFYAIPMHICPTVAKYPEVLTVEGGKVTGSWKVAARDRKIAI